MSSVAPVFDFLAHGCIAIVGVPRDAGGLEYSSGRCGNANAREFCMEHGIADVPGECPYMFLQGEPWFHGFIRKVIGLYPA